MLKTGQGRFECSSKSAGLSLRFEQGEDVSLLDGSLNVTDQSSVRSSDEAHLHLGDASTGAYYYTQQYKRAVSINHKISHSIKHHKTTTYQDPGLM